MLRLALLLLLLAPQNQPCDNAQTQSEMNRCAQEDYLKADRALNSVYGRLMTTVDPSRRKHLKEAERAWIAYRDAECTFEASEAEGGTMQPMLYSGCMADLTKERAKRLATLQEEH